MNPILRHTLIFLILLFSYSAKCNKKQAAIDSLTQLLEQDTLSSESRVDIMTKIIYKYRYRGDQAFALMDGVDSITAAANLIYERGLNFFNRSLHYNGKRQYDSINMQTIEMIDSMSSAITEKKDLPILYNWAYANYHYGLSDYATSEQHLQNCIELVSTIGYEEKLPRLYNELALRQRLQSNYFDAIDNYLKALEYDNVKSCYTYSNLAKIYRDLEDYKNQFLYAEKGRLAALDEKVPNVHITCRLDKGRAYYRMGKIDSAELYFLETLPFIKDSNVKNRDVIAYEYLSRIYYDNKKWAKLESIKPEIEKYKDDNYSAIYFAILGQSYLERGKIIKAEKLCTRAFKACNLNRFYFIKPACDCLVDVYEASGEYEKAFEMSLKARRVDSLTNDKERFVNITRALNKKDLKQQKELLTLAQDKKDQVQQMKLFRFQLLSGFIIFLSLFGLLSYYQLRKRNKKIAIQNQVIKESLEEKDTLLKEIHHRVKNNLQIISSLFSMQMRHVDDESTKRILSDGKNRVRSIALIHQSLYQNNNISQLSFEDYLKEMVKNLFATYKIEDDTVELHLDIQDVQLDIETMISLGLILNELLTNCLKHAFLNNEKGIITIKLDELNDQLVLIVQDNGLGMDEIEFDKNSSFGNKLLRAFSKKLKADFSVENNNGTIVTMIINKYQKTA